MYDNYDKGSSGIVCVMSRHAGNVAGTSVVISKKIADCGVKTVTMAKDWLGQPLKILMPARDKKSSITSEEFALESRDERETGRKKAARALIAALESDLATAQRELKRAQGDAEKTQSKLASQLGKLKEEKESLVSNLEQVKGEANEAAVQASEAKTQAAVLEILETNLAAAQHSLEKSCKKEEDTKSQPSAALGPVQTNHALHALIEDVVVGTKAVAPDEKVSVKTEEKPSQGVQMPSPAAVTDEEAQAAVFANATDKIIFARALTDIASRDAAVRVDAVKTMAGVRHELSVKALDAQMASESSAQVRQECIKALATLEMKEGLPAVEHALTDEAGSVRLAAVWGLYHLAGSESVPALIRMFADEDEEVRRRAATCISWLGKEELAVELLPLLDDNSVSVRRAAAEAMGNLRNRQVVSSLIEQLNDPVKSVRKVVLSAIETITGKKMSKSFPKGEKEFERLVARWQEWWKEELLG